MIKKYITKKWLLIGSVAFCVVLGFALLRKGHGQQEDAIPTIKAQRGPLTISVTSSGSIQSRDKVTITSELEGNNTVIWVIDEGTPVKGGDLLLEFNSSDLCEKYKEQEIVVANAEASLIISQEKLGITQNENESILLDREVDISLAKMAREKYEQGDFPQQLRQYNADIALANEELQRAAERVEWSQRLAKEGFVTRTELQADELSLQQKTISLEMAQTKMNVLTNYTMVQQKSVLASSLRRAERTLNRTAWQNKATIRQIESELRSRLREHMRATNRLEELRVQIEKSKIYAPTNGIVLYASTVLIARRQWWIKPLSVGSTAVQRQELIYIPLESGMIVETMVPEASLNKISLNMVAQIKVDAFPGKTFKGKLVKIGLLPDGQSAQLNPDLKLYKCEIECNFEEMNVRPGMSCSVELLKESYDRALYIPVQCVVRENGIPTVYVRAGNTWQPRAVQVGMDNNRMVHVKEGLHEGDEVMLAPPIKEQKSNDAETHRALQEQQDAQPLEKPPASTTNAGPKHTQTAAGDALAAPHKTKAPKKHKEGVPRTPPPAGATTP